jgi:biopolymer transport protein ExbD
MSLGNAVLRVGTFQKQLLKREQKKKARKRMMVVGLTLTSMVDMFSLLVIFLLQSFATSPELVMVTKGVVLPAAISAKEMKDAPLLSLSTDGVFLDQKPVGKTDDLLKDPTPLMTKLGELRDLWQETHPNETFKGEINLQAHKDLPSTMVSQFMGMLPSQNYGSIQLAVVSGRGK